MKPRRISSFRSVAAFLIFLIVAAACNSSAISADIPIELVKLPPGFKIDIYAAHLPNARSMVLSPYGTLFVGTRKAGRVYAVRDRNEDFYADDLAHDYLSPSLRKGIYDQIRFIDENGKEVVRVNYNNGRP